MKRAIQSAYSRRRFIKQGSILLGGVAIMQGCASSMGAGAATRPKVNAHIWAYASRFPPGWDATPILEDAFADLSYAGIEGVELMENILRHEDAVARLLALEKKYNLPVTGASYGIGMHLWDRSHHKKITDDIGLVVPRLRKVGGLRLGVSVGAARRLKTEKELDDQASILRKILAICKDNGIEVNLHNHTYEVENEMHDLKGTLSRLPEIKLGPDLNWLIRGGVDPVNFINHYGNRIVYLHLRDQYADGRWTEYLGQGVTDFDAIAKALEAQQFRGDAAIELAFEKDFVSVHPLREDWRLSRAFVKKTFGW